MKFLPLNKIYFVILMCLLLFACQDKKVVLQEIKPGFEEYVQMFTSGEELSSATSFIVRLTEPLDSIPAEELSQSLFDFSPSVSGQVQWLDNRTAEFTPSELFENGKIYEVNFKLNKIKEVPREFSVLKYEVRIREQMLKVKSLGFEAISENFDYQQYSGSLITNDNIELEKLDAILQVKFAGKKQQARWEHSHDGLTHTFIIDSLERKDETQKLEVKWNGKSINVKEKGKIEEILPGLNQFEVMNVQIVSGTEQYVLIHFSDPLLKNQQLNGLISFEEDRSPALVIEKNIVKVYPSRRMTGLQEIRIAKGIKNSHSFKLKETVNYQLTFESPRPAVNFIGKGIITPSSEGLVVPFEAVGLKAIDFRIIQIYENNVLQYLQHNSFRYDGDSQLKQTARLILQKRIALDTNPEVNLRTKNVFKVDLAKLINLEAGAIYKVEIRYKRAYALVDCEEGAAELASEEEYELEIEEELEEWDSQHYYSNYYRVEEFDWEEEDNPCHVSYYNYERFASRNVFASNLGITIKGTPSNNYTAIVADLKTTNPVANAQVLFYNYQQQLIGSATTQNIGIAQNVKLKGKPHFAVVKKGEEYGYVKLGNGDALSKSNFDVSGSYVQKGLKGYLYGERGVWRPGDDIHLTFILEDKEHRLPVGHPVIFELKNPLGQIVEKQVNKRGNNGFYTFSIKTDADAPTGNWGAEVKVGGASFYKNLRVETVKPNRIKVNLDFGGKEIFQENLKDRIEMQANWLHGASANKLKADVKVNMYATNTTFKGYHGYQFSDPAKNFESEEETVFDGQLDAEGKASFSTNLKLKNAPSKLHANFTSRVFEAGGEFSIVTQGVTFSPYKNYVGVRMQDKGRNSWYPIDQTHRVEVASVDEKGKPISLSNVKVKVYKLGWRWWWNSRNEDIASFISRESQRPVFTKTISTANGKGSFDLKVEYEDYYSNGRYLVQVTDGEGGHATGQIIYLSEWYGSGSNETSGATMLAFASDKDVYEVGEQVNITIPSSKNGRALVSIENGSQVQDIFWVKTEEQETKFSFELKEEMSPNVFVNISLIQPHAQTINDNPIRMYGVIPIKVNNPHTKLEPVIKMPEKLKPEESYEIKVSEKAGKAMTYTLAVVDEGLLDLTQFKTPNPWNTFYAQEALGVRTWDVYDYVVGAYGAQLETAFAVGGGAFESAELMANGDSQDKANRFKSVVKFIGPFNLKKGEEKTHQLTMPNYIGSVRVMLVAGDNGAYGSAEKQVAVKKDLMLLATLPRVVGPNEVVKLPATVFAMNSNIKNVQVAINTNSLFTVQGSKSQSLNFKKEGDQLATFDLKVADRIGVGKVNLVATSGSHKATYEIEIDVRSSNPPVTEVVDTILRAGQVWEANLQALGIANTNSGKLELSGMPPINLGKRLDYLIAYPHGCIEQTTSAVFPQLHLNTLMELSENQRIKTDKNIKAGLTRLSRFQVASGGFSYWPGNRDADSWGTTYAGHFMLAAEKKGYTLSSVLKNRWIQYQKSAANSWKEEDGSMEQAYRLYTLALANTPEVGAMNRLRESAKLSNRAKWRLAAAYALIGQKSTATDLVNALSIDEVAAPRRFDRTYGSQTRDRAMILETLKLLDRKEEGFKVLQMLSKELSSKQWMSTQTTAYSLVAIAGFFSGEGAERKDLHINYKINGEGKDLRTKEVIVQKDISFENKNVNVYVKNKSDDLLYARVILQGVPSEGQEKSRAENVQVVISYTDLSGKPINPARIKQGTDFLATVKVTNPGILGNYSEMALTQIFPSGWEIINTRLFDRKVNEKADTPDYLDIRDDRVYTYFDIPQYKTRTYSVLLNAAYQGRYYLPSVSTASMYEENVGALVPGQWVEVVE